MSAISRQTTTAAVRAAVPQVAKKLQSEGVQRGVLSQVWARATDLTIDHGEGVFVFDVDGNRYLDASAGIAVCNTGHAHPKVVAAIQKQAAKMLHSQINNYHSKPLYELTERLGAVLPEGVNHIYYDNTGTGGIEAAVKLVRHHTKRPHIIVLHGGMHGRSATGSAMTSNHSIRNPVSYPLPSGFYTAPFPCAYRWGVTPEEATHRALQGLKDVLKGNVRAEQVAAVFFEPILGEGGFMPVTPQYYEAVRSICNDHGIMLVMDEIQSGYGRSGKMWGHQWMMQNSASTPDVLVSSKGIASGMPLSMVAAKEEVMRSFTPGTHGGTFNANPVALAAAIATLEVFEEEGLVANSLTQGETLKRMLAAIFKVHLPKSDVRGMGLMIGLDCADEHGNPLPEAARYIQKHCLQKSNVIMLTPTGFDGNILRVMPPLIIKEDEVFELAHAVENALADFVSGRPLDD
eukprot:gene2245-3469_t